MFASQKEVFISVVLLAVVSGCSAPVIRPAAHPEPAQTDSAEWWIACAAAEAAQLIVDQNQSRLADFGMDNSPDYARMKVDLYRRIADMHTDGERIDLAKAAINQAIPLCRWIYRQNNPDVYKGQLACSIARYGDSSGARSLAGRIFRDTEREQAYACICGIETAAGDLAAARQTFSLIKEEPWQVNALVKMASALAAAGDIRSRDVMNEASGKLPSLTGVSFFRQMGPVIEFWAKNDGQKQVERLLERAQSAIDENCDNADRIWGYTEIGMGYFRIGDDRLAEKYFERAQQAIAGGQAYFRYGDHKRSVRLEALSDAQAKVGDWQGAAATAEKIEVSLTRAAALVNIARRQVGAKVDIGVKNSIDAAKTATMAISSTGDRDLLLVSIARIYAQMGDLNGLRGTIDQLENKSLGAAAMVDYYTAREDLRSAANSLRDSLPPGGQTGNATLAMLEARSGKFTEALKIIDEMPSPHDRALTYLKIAQIHQPLLSRPVRRPTSTPVATTSAPTSAPAPTAKTSSQPQSQPAPLNITTIAQMTDAQRKEQYDLRIDSYHKYLEDEKWPQADDELKMAEMFYPDGRKADDIADKRNLLKYSMYKSMGMTSAKVGDWKLAIGCFQSAQQAIDNAEIRQLIASVQEKLGESDSTSRPTTAPATTSQPADWRLPTTGDFQ